jgi:hypothetical protein
MTNQYHIFPISGNSDERSVFFNNTLTASDICKYFECCGNANNWIIPVAIIATLLLFSRRKEKR